MKIKSCQIIYSNKCSHCHSLLILSSSLLIRLAFSNSVSLGQSNLLIELALVVSGSEGVTLTRAIVKQQ